jgi:hypothetical protein
VRLFNRYLHIHKTHRLSAHNAEMVILPNLR